MRARNLMKLLAATIAARLPVMITGAPGVGKSGIVLQACGEAGADVVIMHPVVSDPTDARGLAWADQGAEEAKFLPYGDLAKLMRAERLTACFIDDLGQATPAVQASFMQLILAREINGKRISDNVVFVAATNRRTDRAGVSGILEPVKSRFATIVELEANAEDWCDWAVNNGIEPEVVAYLRLQPESLHDFQPTADMTNSPCPRTWERVSQLLALHMPAAIETPAIHGAIGVGEGAKFIAFLTMYRDMPSIDDILLDPKGAAVPKDSGPLWAVASGLATYANAENFERVLQYAERLPQEFGIACVRDASRRNKGVTKTAAWLRYATGPLGRAVIGDAA